jgi:hypothetical protein
MSGGIQQHNPFDDLSASISEAARIQATSAREAGDLMRGIADQNMSFLREQANIARTDLAPFRQAGLSAQNELTNLLGLNGNQVQGQAVNKILQGAETQAKLNFGTDAIARTAAAGGQLQSGRVMEQLFKYGTDLAATQIGATQDRLLQLTGVGAQAAGQSASISNLLGQTLSQQNQMGGEAQSNAILAAGNANANAATTKGQIDFAAFQNGYGPNQGVKGIGGLLGALAGPLALAGAEMGGLPGLGLLLGGAGSFLGSKNFI